MISSVRLSPFTSFDAPPRNQMEVAYAPEDIVRLDVVRRTEQKVITKPDGTTETRTESAPLSPFGLSLGNGLFYDLNGNLSLVPLMCFHAPIASAMQAGFGVDPSGVFNETTVERTGNQVVIDAPGPLNEVTFTANGDTVSMDPVGPMNETTIRRSSDGIVVSPPFLSGSIVIHTGSDEWRIQTGPFTSTSLRIRGDQVELDAPGFMNSTTITRSGNTIRVDPSGLFNEIDIKVAPDRITIDRPGFFNSTTVKREGDNVVVDPAGALNGTTLRPL